MKISVYIGVNETLVDSQRACEFSNNNFMEGLDLNQPSIRKLIFRQHPILHPVGL